MSVKNLVVPFIALLTMPLNGMQRKGSQTPYITLIFPDKQELIVPIKNMKLTSFFGQQKIKLQQPKNPDVCLEKKFVFGLITTPDLATKALRMKNNESVIYTADYLHLKRQGAFLATIAAQKTERKNVHFNKLLRKLHPVQSSVYNTYTDGHLMITDPKCNTLHNFVEGVYAMGLHPEKITQLTLKTPRLDGIHPQNMGQILATLKNLHHITIEETKIETLYKGTFKFLPTHVELIIASNQKLQSLEPGWYKPSYKSSLTIKNNRYLSFASHEMVAQIQQQKKVGYLQGCKRNIGEYLAALCTSETIETMHNVTLDAALISVSMSIKGSEFNKYALLKAVEARYLKEGSMQLWGLGIRMATDAAMWAIYNSYIVSNSSMSEEEKTMNFYLTTGLCILSATTTAIHGIRKMQNKLSTQSNTAVTYIDHRDHRASNYIYKYNDTHSSDEDQDAYDADTEGNEADTL